MEATIRERLAATVPTTRSSARSSAPRATPPAAGSSTPSTAPRASCGASRSGRRFSPSRSRSGCASASCRRPRSDGDGGPRRDQGAFATANRSASHRSARSRMRSSATRRRRRSTSSAWASSSARSHPVCWAARGFADFWGHVLVAEGAADLAVEPVMNLWDNAALQVILEEAGGRFTDLHGVPPPTAATPSPPTASCTTPCSRAYSERRGSRPRATLPMYS